MACQNPNSISFFLPSAFKSHRFVHFNSSSLLISRHVRPLIFSNSSLNIYCSHFHTLSTAPFSPSRIFCKTAEYVFPDPIPEFAESETSKFRVHLLERLSKKDIFDDSLEEIVEICTEILSNFLHTEYGGPGTLLVVPFIDMADTIQERGLPGGPQAARAAVVWAQNNIDKDWKDWTGDPNL